MERVQEVSVSASVDSSKAESIGRSTRRPRVDAWRLDTGAFCAS
jgi:hypothetical protein